MIKSSEIGRLGEDLACKFLNKRGYSIIGRNYRKFYGEIDIIARCQKGIVRFVEVKSVSREMSADFSRETSESLYKPEENIHPAKIQRLVRTAGTFIAEHRINVDWQMDAVAVFIDTKGKRAAFRYLENIIA